MATEIGKTHEGTPIGAWMFLGDPEESDLFGDLADPDPDGEWVWGCDDADRARMIQAGHPCLFWITDNDHPDLPAGIWLVGEATGPCEDAETWDPETDETELVPFAQLRLETLAVPIRWADLREHPVLKDLEILTTPATSNPQIVTPEQLDALQSDFGLATAALADDVRDRLREAASDDDHPDLVLVGPGDTVVQVYADPEAWTIWIGDGEVAQHEGWADAFRDALRRADPDPAISEDPDQPIVLAELHAGDGLIWIMRTGADTYQAVVELEGDESAHEIDGTYPTLEAAVLELAANLLTDD